MARLSGSKTPSFSPLVPTSRARMSWPIRRAARYGDSWFTLPMETLPVVTELVDEHAIDAEIHRQRESVGRIGDDAMRVRPFLSLGVGAFPLVLHNLRWLPQ